MGFLEKLKGGMGIEEPEKVKTIKAKKKAKPGLRPEPKKEEPEAEDAQTEGELAIDVFETGDDIVIQSPIGGTKAEDLDISIEDDMVTIRGNREHLVEKQGRNYVYQECYWGSFARKVILPEKVDESRAKATMKNGILTLVMPKLRRKKMKKVAVKEEEQNTP